MTRSLQPNPGILDIAPYVGGESKLADATPVIKLSSNEGALGPSPAAMQAFEAMAGDIFRYPDGSASALRTAISDVTGLKADRIVCGAGSDELLSLLTYSYASNGDEVLYTVHGFLMYPICAKSVGATPIAVAEKDLCCDVDALLAAVTDKTRIVFIANPNNPTGSYVSTDELRRLRQNLPDGVLLVLDGAYAEYVTEPDYNAGETLVNEFPNNTVMTRTFSKIYALGGLRLGWAYGGPEVIDTLNRMRGPFNVSSAALAAGAAAMHDQAFVTKVRDHTTAWRDKLSSALMALGLDVRPSVCNFLLVGFPDQVGHDAEAADAFLKSKGIIVRRMNGYGLPGYLRITIGNEAEMNALIAAMTEFRSTKA